MANSIKRDKNRRILISKYEIRKLQYISIIKDSFIPNEIKMIYIEKLNKLPRNSSKVRSRNRCILTGRGRAVFRFCKLSRIALRDLTSQGIITGVKKSSW